MNTQIITSDNRKIVLLTRSDVGQYVTAGETVKIVVDPGTKVDTIQFQDVTNPKVQQLGDKSWDTQPPYEYSWVVPAAISGVLRLQIESRLKGEQVGSPIVYPIMVKPATSKPTPTNDGEGQPGSAPVDNAVAYVAGLCISGLPKINVPVSSNLWKGTKPITQVVTTAGIIALRLWWTCIGDAKEDLTHAPPWDRVRQWKAAGIKTFVFALACGKWPAGAKVPSAEAFKASAEAIRDIVPEDLKSCVMFEIGNEEKYGNAFWFGTDAEFAKNFFNPMNAIFQAAGFMTILGGLNGGDPAGDYKELKTAGLDDADFVGYHPYAINAADYKKKTTALAAATGDIPLIETEANTRDGPEYMASDQGTKATAKVAANQAAVDAERVKIPAVVASYEFGAEKLNQTMTWPLGWLTFTRENNVVTAAKTSALFELRFGGKFKAAA